MKIAILGGGIGGLTTAIALQKKGYDVKVYEAAPELKALGAGLAIAANAMKAFQHIGIAEKILQEGKMLEYYDIMDEHGKVITRNSPQQFGEKIQSSNFMIHRADLHKTLIAELLPGTLITNKRCKDISQHNQKVNIDFEDGTNAEVDYVIAADGIHSVVRNKLLPDAKTRYAGHTCWRAVIDNTIADLDVKKATETWGTKGRFGITPLKGNRIYWYACVDFPQNDARAKAFSTDDLYANFKDYHQPIPQIIQATKNEQLIQGDILDIPPIKKFAFGRILLLGDAAHATTPNLGQGACQAIEDAAYLADLMAKNKDPEAAFQTFEKMRISRTTFVVNTSWRIGKVAHISNPILAKIRNMVFGLLPESINNKQLKYLLDIEFN